MRLAARLTLFVGVVALAPLIALGVSATQLAGDQTQRHIASLQARTVDGLALSVDTWLSRSLGVLALQSGSFDPLELNDAKRVGYLQLLYRQTPAAQIVALSDREGAVLGSPLYLSEPSTAFPDRSPVSQTQLETFFDQARSLKPTDAIVVGRPYQAPGRVVYVLPLAVPIRQGQAVVTVELGLQELARWLQAQSSEVMEVGLLDQDGHLFLASSTQYLIADFFAPFLSTDQPTAPLDVSYATPGGVEVLASSAPVANTGWTVVAAAPRDVVTASQRSVQARMAYIAAVLTLVSLLWGIGFARGLARPIVQLKDAALGVADGQLGRSVPIPSTRDELADLGRAFNHMSASLESSAREIAEKNDEIEAFNRELQQRVEERTAQLQAAQARLVRSERLAAVGELSSGIAHELNNPMAGILGLAQLLRSRDPDDPLVSSIEEQALRCREILTHLNQLTEQPSERPGADVIDLSSLLRGVLTVVREQLNQRGIEVSVAALPPMRSVGDRAALGRALTTTILGLRSLHPQTGGTLTVSPHQAPGQVGLVITAADAQPPGGDDWMASGLGLWVARQIFGQHQGGLTLPDTGDAPLVFTIWLPEAPADA